MSLRDKINMDFSQPNIDHLNEVSLPSVHTSDLNNSHANAALIHIGNLDEGPPIKKNEGEQSKITKNNCNMFARKKQATKLLNIVENKNSTLPSSLVVSSGNNSPSPTRALNSHRYSPNDFSRFQHNRNMKYTHHEVSFKQIRQENSFQK